MKPVESFGTFVVILTAIVCGFAAPVLMPLSTFLGVIAVILCIFWSLWVLGALMLAYL